jgi:hypothetical protein
MDPISSLAQADAVFSVSETLWKGWGWLRKRRFGNVSITHPTNRSVVEPEWVLIEGSHNNPVRGNFWLFTTNGVEYWPQTRINLRPDGSWSERININPNPGPRTASVLLVYLNDFADALFTDIKRRSNKAKDWGPVKIPSKAKEFSIVQGLVLQVTTKILS